MRVNPAPVSAPRPARRALWFEAFCGAIPRGVTPLKLREGDSLYLMGHAADSVFFVKTGKFRRSAFSPAGQEAVLGILKPGGFCGEGCLTGQPLRLSSVTALSPATVVRVAKGALARALHKNQVFSASFLKHLLVRTGVVEKDLCGQLFNRIEKRLARALVRLSRYNQGDEQSAVSAISTVVSQGALAKLIGVGRAHMGAIMAKFRELGMVDYGGRVPKGEVRIHPRLLLEVVLCE
jgi:CRP/FNR family cyclic AMP-dependent transcriptional regulator